MARGSRWSRSRHREGVRDFYHSKFIPAEPNFYHFNTGSEELATFTGRLILTPKFRLRFARPDPHAMYMAALSRKGGARASRRAARVGRATRRGCAGACMRRLCASTSDPRILGHDAHSAKLVTGVLHFLLNWSAQCKASSCFSPALECPVPPGCLALGTGQCPVPRRNGRRRSENEECEGKNG